VARAQRKKALDFGGNTDRVTLGRVMVTTSHPSRRCYGYVRVES